MLCQQGALIGYIDRMCSRVRLIDFVDIESRKDGSGLGCLGRVHINDSII